MIKKQELSPFFHKFVQQEDEKQNGIFLDLHMHTPASDGLISTDYLEKFAEDKCYLMSVTDHNAIEGNLELRKRGIAAVPGLELGCEDGLELLCYFAEEAALVEFYEKEVKPFKNPYRMAKTYRHVFDYLEVLEDYDCQLSIPHIAGFFQKNFVENKAYIYDLIDMVDAIEIENGALPKGKNFKAKSLQKQYKKFATLGSDAHSVQELRHFFQKWNEGEKTPSGIITSLSKAGSLAAIGEKHLRHLVMSYKHII